MTIIYLPRNHFCLYNVERSASSEQLLPVLWAQRFAQKGIAYPATHCASYVVAKMVLGYSKFIVALLLKFMTKKIIFDVIKPKSKSKIVSTTPQDEGRKVPIITPSAKRVASPSKVYHEATYPIRDNNGSKFSLWTIAVVSFIFLLFSSSLLFARAEVVITPKSEEFLVDSEFLAEKDSSGKFSFEVMSINDEKTKVLTATKTVNVEKKATGTILIYNSFSSSPQKLLIDTRLLATNGKIYKTEKAIVVPGATIKDGEMIPGSVEVSIYAEDVGEEYNSDPSDFAIIGFKGSPKYTKFYGRSKGGGITGGFKGTANIIDEEEVQTTKEALKKIIRERLTTKAMALVPNGFVLYKDAIFVFFLSEAGNNKEPINITKETTLPVTEKGSLYAFIFNKEKLENKIINDVARLPERDEGNYTISNINDFNFTLKNKEQIMPDQAKSIIFSLFGPAKIHWPVNVEKIANNLASRQKKEFKSILSGYDNIDKAEVILKPFWKFSFPDDPAKIKVTVKNAQN